MSLDCGSIRRVYNTIVCGAWDFKLRRLKIESEDGDVLRCPECSAEIDVDEDEVEEREILSCPECECELEGWETHPVALNPISDDLDEEEAEEEDEDDEDNVDKDGDLPEDEDDDDEAEDEDE